MRTSLAALSLACLLAACDKPPAPPPAGPAGGPGPAASAGGASSLPKGDVVFHFGGNEARTNVNFSSKTEITDIIGQTHKVRGSATINWEKSSGSCEIAIPTASLNSGMDDRDRAMLGKQWLNAKEFPGIEFKGQAVAFNAPSTWKVKGPFTLHGVTKEIEVEAEVKYVSEELAKKVKLGDGAWVKVTTSFVVKLADYGIVIPESAVATVRPTIDVSIDLWGSTVAPATLVKIEAPTEDGEEGPIRVVRPPKVSAEGIEGTRYVFGKKPQLAQFTATSETQFEKITVNTKILGGLAGVDAAKGLGKVRLALPVTSLKSGISQRDEHMLSADWLDAKQFPLIEFESTKATQKDVKTWAVEGTFSLHGVKKPVSLDVAVRAIPLEQVQQAKWGDKPGMGFAGSFKIKLSDHGIKISEAAQGKVNDEWTITFDIKGLLDE